MTEFSETSVSWGALRKAAEDATRPLPPDFYDVTVVKAEYRVASTGSNMIAVTFEVDGGAYKTRRLFTNFVLSTDNGFALGMFFRNMNAFGLDDAFFTSIQQYPIEQGMELIAQALFGRSVRTKVGVRKWQGQDRNECVEFTPRAGGGPVAPGVVTGPPSVVGPGGPGGPSAFAGPQGTLTPPSPTAQTPAVVPTTPMTPTSPTASSTPQVPGPPPPPQPAF